MSFRAQFREFYVQEKMLATISKLLPKLRGRSNSKAAALHYEIL
jgi:hypothetical protein